MEKARRRKMEKAGHRVGYKWYSVDLQTLSMKMAFFSEGWRRGCHWPFMIVFFVDLGLTKSQAGFVNGLRLIGSLLSGSLWGMVADKSKKHRLIVLVQTLGGITFMSFYIIVDIYLRKNSRGISSEENNQTFPVEQQNLTGNISSQYSSNDDSDSKNNTALFWTLLFLNVLVTFFDGNLTGFVDTGVIRKMDLLPYRCDYGVQRMFSSVGFAFGFLVSDVLSRTFEGVEGISKYTGVIISYTLAMVLLQISCHMLYKGVHFDDNASSEAPATTVLKKKTLLKLILKTCRQPRVLFFLFTVGVQGVEVAFQFYFLVLYMKSINAAPVFFTLSFAAASFSGIVGFRFSSHVIKLSRGVWNVFILAFVSFSVRYLVYSVTSNPWLILLMQPLHAVGFNVFICAAVRHVKEISPLEILTTMYGIRTTVQFSIAYIAGNIIGGYTYESFGGTVMYGGAAVLSFAWALLTGVFVVLSPKEKISAVTLLPDVSTDNENEEESSFLKEQELRTL